MVASVEAALKEQLGTQLSDGKITQAQYDKQVAKLSDIATKLVNGKVGGKLGFGLGFIGGANLLASDGLATLLGLTADELKTKLKAGDSLATIAAAQNVSVDSVIASVTATLKEQLSAQLSDGKITQAQYDEQAAKLSDIAAKLVNGEFKGGNRGGKGFGFGGLNLLASDKLATLLGLTADELKEKLQAGDSLATIAAAQNVSVDSVVASVTATLKEQLSTQLSNGKITQAQYDEQVAKLSDIATKLVNAARPEHAAAKDGQSSDDAKSGAEFKGSNGGRGGHGGHGGGFGRGNGGQSSGSGSSSSSSSSNA
ncbi:LysM peptidoglycan-binding domain-containing protein [Cohnella sp. AR92]|uniref:LysM peptidoglycan-binding domain-containing protein n=1 Tax=Cohnella sp. AR92 TaxID=648716 RepID=UPI000F8C834E|nr:LysM peptidoglycan-binding domain-containing protein [Cohnella sp. AR92]RUS45025.1 hypothetical protein ELR57_21020 [Cohnella sp. AR92]